MDKTRNLVLSLKPLARELRNLAMCSKIFARELRNLAMCLKNFGRDLRNLVLCSKFLEIYTKFDIVFETIYTTNTKFGSV